MSISDRQSLAKPRHRDGLDGGVSVERRAIISLHPNPETFLTVNPKPEFLSQIESARLERGKILRHFALVRLSSRYSIEIDATLNLSVEVWGVKESMKTIRRTISKNIRNAEIRPAAHLLRSWKQISSYMDLNIRTVQRYELNFGLPVHRPPGAGDRHSVWAFADEIDAWLKHAGSIHFAPPKSVPTLNEPGTNSSQTGANTRPRVLASVITSGVSARIPIDCNLRP